jgi:tRNA pseudouridine38-40 synthase
LKNYKLIIQYDGTNYCGWQIQLNADSVQGIVQDSINKITRESVNLIGAGRTDAGVHSLGQTANFRIENELDLYRFKHSLNSTLPRDIAVTSIEEVDEEFHSRYDAVKRSYIYLIAKGKTPFYDRYSWWYHGKIDCSELNRLSVCLLGEYNFTAFSRKASETENKICNIHEIRWKEWKGLVVFYVEADRYLHGMVRTMVGTLLNSLKLGKNIDYIWNIINKKERESAGEAVPAKGLFLYKVKYKANGKIY